jgi:hypothetical protein
MAFACCSQASFVDIPYLCNGILNTAPRWTSSVKSCTLGMCHFCGVRALLGDVVLRIATASDWTSLGICAYLKRNNPLFEEEKLLNRSFQYIFLDG